jgi:hypothetical protein
MRETAHTIKGIAVYLFIDVLHGKPRHVFIFWAAFTGSQSFLEGFRKTIAAGKSDSSGVWSSAFMLCFVSVAVSNGFGRQLALDGRDNLFRLKLTSEAWESGGVGSISKRNRRWQGRI